MTSLSIYCLVLEDTDMLNKGMLEPLPPNIHYYNDIDHLNKHSWADIDHLNKHSWADIGYLSLKFKQRKKHGKE